MNRVLSALVVVILVSGCQSSFWTQSLPPSRLNERLGEIEQARLASAAHEQGVRSVSRELPGLAWANRGGAEASAADRGAGEPLSLADLGEPGVMQDRAAQNETSSRVADDNEYLHRSPMPTLWENMKRDVKTMPGDLWHDTKQVYGNPVNVGILAAAYGGSLAVQETGPDDTVERHFKPGHHAFPKGWRNTFNAVGNPGTHFAVAGAWYLLGEQLQDDKTYNVSKTLASALIINGVTTMIGQTASWDRDPSGRWGTFPSGHTSSSFCIAAVMDRSYGHLVGVPMYGLATMVAMERVDDRDHYFSDVLMGAVLGTVVGNAVASGRDPDLFGWKILPWASPEGGSGIALYKSFD